MRKLFFFLITIAFALPLLAQDQTVKEMQTGSQRTVQKDTIQKEGWTTGGAFSLNLAQGSSSNWAAGAEKFSLSTASFLTVFANHKSGSWYWDNTLDLNYALLRTSSQGTRKADDRIDLFSKLARSFSDAWRIASVFNLRTQFANGFDYDYLGKGLKRRTSGFFAPAYILLSPGIEWKPVSYFSLFLSPLSARWVIVSNDPFSYYYPNGITPEGVAEKPLAAYYGVLPRKEVSFEAGAFASANFSREIWKNVLYKSRLDLYSNYLQKNDPITGVKQEAKPQNVDVNWTNGFVMKVNRFLSVSYNFDLIYDDDVKLFGPRNTAPAAQIRSLLGVGFAAKF